jgi:hypothetical protein
MPKALIIGDMIDYVMELLEKMKLVQEEINSSRTHETKDMAGK